MLPTLGTLSLAPVNRSSTAISVEKFDDCPLINGYLWRLFGPIINLSCDIPNVKSCQVMNDVNYDLSIGTNWTLDMFIFSWPFPMSSARFVNWFRLALKLTASVPRRARTRRVSEVLSINFQLFSFLKTFKQHNGCHARKYNGWWGS